ncbi:MULTISPECIES: Tm-1-like ATP-binding domain-containing protein [Dethiosulfovibrio]|uniref:Tm-1-like ATP-binding domain-containing protein n=2 Tax=Dethiosulfovibrio TaxID=47054 RepID=A0ABS9EM37_9BACT|nr:MULTISPECIES: Tm-1-like ATP-binding domain-containing protein [Dethiosulfovibrio]MCF4113204.1 Tm-1-like ATP-binding domain-containing protein [Dethiosulfovibrio russensis]MCF4142268.1 Tm-1-like ATP-binding domain-containing protein [Dethiosulfovibrio marinus]MCF4144576.1 Tm-1-like ATP-binding domain-containing protein [Dethiosulfovibrio acidaminovorans]
MKKAFIIGTCDTKFAELDYGRRLIDQAGIETVLVDVGSMEHGFPVDVTNREVASFHPEGADFLADPTDRGKTVSAMGVALERFLLSRDDVGGVLGMGGSGNTSLVTQGMRVLPIGTPRMMVSTMGSGDVSPYVGPNDICMVYSVTDIAGLNPISRRVIGNAAHGLAGMMTRAIPEAAGERPLLGLSMFGVTTPCVETIREIIGDEYECMVFHATGTGGMSLEKLVDSGMMTSVIDVTLTEICDHLMGGVLSAGEDRLGAFIRTGIPYVGSVGAQDMVNFGPMDTVPERYSERNLYVHNPQVTLMRTTAEENRTMGRWIGEKLNRLTGPVRFLLPEKGVSMIDAPGMPFYDPEADEALFSALEDTFVQTEAKKLLRLPYHVNDREFAQALVDNFREISE